MEDSSKTSAAQAVLEWLNSHPYEHDIAKRYAACGPQYLGNWVQQELYPPSFLHLHPDESRKMIALRDSFTREAFDLIDWPSVWFELTHGSAQLIREVGWRLSKEIAREAYLKDLVYAEDLKLSVGEWRGETRDGAPMVISWVSATTGRLLSAYEITGRAS